MKAREETARKVLEPHRRSQRTGKAFEKRLDASFQWLREQGWCLVEKTPEPVRIIKALGGGRFEAAFAKRAQPDYKGVIPLDFDNVGQMVVFEAKYTDAEKLEQAKVRQDQAAYLDEYTSYGVRCCILAGFGTGNVYAIPWRTWKAMKQLYGRKYVTELDLPRYWVPEGENGTLLIIDRSGEMPEDEDFTETGLRRITKEG